MDESSNNLWYQLGFALEQVRTQPSRDRIESLGRKLAAFRRQGQAPTPAVRSTSSKAPVESGEAEGAETLDWLLASLSGAAIAKVLRGWRPRKRPGPYLLLRAAAAGAAAIIFQEAAHALLSDDPRRAAQRSRDLPERLISGTARGLLYGAVAEPRLPGPPVLRGVAFGTAEYLLSPLGGLGKVLGKHAPYARIPAVKSLLDEVGWEDEGYVEHLVFGMGLALMAGETRAAPGLYRGAD